MNLWECCGERRPCLEALESGNPAVAAANRIENTRGVGGGSGSVPSYLVTHTCTRIGEGGGDDGEEELVPVVVAPEVGSPARVERNLTHGMKGTFLYSTL